ncbi:hypothetical protein K491DRAFT_349342 [Lophiostoma macrostomum CBS 122681]|uniref:Uncharacterized protein n=1 Tax=Lophiostoma macrostomum CBS 122681 TaxID=1314788 RepID=A0A6A6TB79_9PLEO|nr:hypothetical protein K491DRAFT_349342 [Lophiostoma macrostomum CBS 122681]
MDWQWYQSDGADINPRNGDFENTGWGIADAFRGLHVSDRSVNQGGENYVAWMQHGQVWVDKDGQWEHRDVKGQPYTVQGKQYKYTEAYYQWAMNPEQGALNLVSPSHAVSWPSSELPLLRRASDVMYGTWHLVNSEGTDPAALKHYIVAGIVNEDSKAIIVRAYGDADVAEWPGRTMSAGSREAEALLGKCEEVGSGK